MLYRLIDETITEESHQYDWQSLISAWFERPWRQSNEKKLRPLSKALSATKMCIFSKSVSLVEKGGYFRQTGFVSQHRQRFYRTWYSFQSGDMKVMAALPCRDGRLEMRFLFTSWGLIYYSPSCSIPHFNLVIPSWNTDWATSLLTFSQMRVRALPRRRSRLLDRSFVPLHIRRARSHMPSDLESKLDGELAPFFFGQNIIGLFPPYGTWNCSCSRPVVCYPASASPESSFDWICLH
jgi:hypothetical protein